MLAGDKVLEQADWSPGFGCETRKILKGSFLYNLCGHLSTQLLPDQFLSEMLVKGSPLHRCFQRLEDLVLGNLSTGDEPVDVAWSVKEKKGSKGRSLAPGKALPNRDGRDVVGITKKVDNEATCDLQNRFAGVSVEGESD